MKHRLRFVLRLLHIPLLLIVGAAGILIALLLWGNNKAAQSGDLPEVGGLRYYIVTEDALAELPKDSLLLLAPRLTYETGDLLLLPLGGPDPADLLDQRYLPVHLTGSLRQLSGETLISGNEVFFQNKDVLGKIFQILPGWGRICVWAVEPLGGLLWWGILLLLAILTGLGRLLLSRGIRRAQAVPAPAQPEIPAAETIHSQIRVLPGTTPPPPGRGGEDDPYAEIFRVEEKPEFDPPDKLDLFARQQDPAPVQTSPEPAFAPAPPEAAVLPDPEPSASPEPAPEEAPAQPEPLPSGWNAGDTIEFDPIRPDKLSGEPLPLQEPEDPLPDWEGAVAIYDPEGEEPPSLAPDYLYNPTGDSLEELKAELREAESRSPSVPVQKEPDPPEEEEAEFDPDRIIAEIKRKNALYEQSLWEGGLGGMSKKRDHPASHRWRGVYRSGQRSADEVIRAHQQDYASQRFRPSFITVVGEIGEEDSAEKLSGHFFEK